MHSTPKPKNLVAFGGPSERVRAALSVLRGRVVSLRGDGQVSAVSVARRRAITLRSVFPLVSAEATTGWVHAAKTGEWAGHPAGEFEFNDEAFRQIKANFDALENKAIPLTYDHPEYDGRSPVEQAGWVHELEVRADGLWAFCEFTDKAVQLNREGSYKFASVVVVFDSTDRKSGDDIGAEMIELALTSAPFIDGLQATSL